MAFLLTFLTTLQLFPAADVDPELTKCLQEELQRQPKPDTKLLCLELLATWTKESCCAHSGEGDDKHAIQRTRLKDSINLTAINGGWRHVSCAERADCQVICTHPAVLEHSDIRPKEVNGRCVLVTYAVGLSLQCSELVVCLSMCCRHSQSCPAGLCSG